MPVFGGWARVRDYELWINECLVWVRQSLYQEKWFLVSRYHRQNLKWHV